MTTVLSSASQATVNVFDTISTTANAATKLVTGIATGANMFERMMTDMDTDHADRSKIHRATYRQELFENTARDNAKRQSIIRKELMEDKDYSDLYSENYKKLEALFIEQTAK